MSGSVVTIRVNGQPYQMGCDAGQEAQIEAFGKMVDDTVSQLVANVGQIGETRLLVMAAILLAEKSASAGEDSHAGAQLGGEMIEDAQIAQLEKLAQTISALAASVKSA